LKSNINEYFNTMFNFLGKHIVEIKYEDENYNSYVDGNLWFSGEDFIESLFTVFNNHKDMNGRVEFTKRNII
jgi:hypothetical protein